MSASPAQVLSAATAYPVTGRQFAVSLGIDPGGTSGLFLGAWGYGRHRVPLVAMRWQCDMGSTPELLEMILGRHGRVIGAVGIEAWDDRKRPLHGFSPSAMTKLISELHHIAAGSGVPVVRIRAARDVKPWATDRKLQAAGLGPALFPAAMKHSRDGARHALFTACKDLGLRDPHSRAGTASETEEDSRSCPEASP